MVDIQTALVMGWIIHSPGYYLSWSRANWAQLGSSCVCAWWGERQVQTWAAGVRVSSGHRLGPLRWHLHVAWASSLHGTGFPGQEV